MICPNCGSNIPDGLFRCPACHADLDRTVVIHRPLGLWCTSCGSLIPEGADVCPSCGLPVPGRAARRAVPAGSPAVSQDTVGDLATDHDETNQLARIESAIPSEDDDSSPVAEHDRMPRTKVLVLTMAIAVAAATATMLVITHPWNPDAFDTSAKTEADTSMAGFPGTITELSGQDAKDGSSSSGGVKSGDDATYESLDSAYESLGELAGKVDENEELFESIAFTGSAEERRDGRDAAESLSYQISNLIGEIEDVDVTSGTYADDAKNLSTLGNYLRNRMDALLEAWERDADSDDPSADRDSIEAPLGGSDGSSVTQGYKKLFDDNYDAWKPTSKSDG